MTVPLKDKKSIAIVDAFLTMLNDSKRKPDKIWVDKGSGFYNRSEITVRKDVFNKRCFQCIQCIQHIVKENLLLLKDLLEL